MTNQFDVVRFLACSFGELYHQSWRIEEAFELLKHRLNLEHVSGLSQQAVVQYVASKVPCDNLQALTVLSASNNADLPESVRINVPMCTAATSLCCLRCCIRQAVAQCTVLGGPALQCS